MKKLLAGIFIGALLFTSVSMAADVTERQDIQIVVNGGVVDNGNTPIIVNSRTLLPLRDLVTALGVPNDSEHIIWDNEERKVYINSEDTHIELTIDSDIALLNGEEMILDAPAIIYNDFTYIPARFVGEALNKKIGWDSYDSKVLVRDGEMYGEVRQVFADTERIMADVRTLKATAAVDLGYQNSGDVMNIKTYMELDLPKEEVYTVAEAKFADLVSSNEQYFAGGKYYTPNELGVWEETYTDQTFEVLKNYANDFTDFSIKDETLYDIFTIDTEKTNEEVLVLRNDVMYKGLMEELNGTAQSAIGAEELGEIKELTFEYYINRATGNVESLIATMVIEDAKANDDMYVKVELEIIEFNTDFTVYNPLVY